MDLFSNVENINGIGPKTAQSLSSAGILTVRDLLYYLPRDYDAFQGAGHISDLKPGKVVVKATVDNVTSSRRRRNLSITEASLRDSSGAVRAVWFNQPYREKQFKKGEEYYFSGNFEFSFGRYQLINPQAINSHDYDKSDRKFQPVYPSRGSLKSQDFAKFIRAIKPFFVNIPDLIPDHPGRAEALFKLHFPDNEKDVMSGRAYLAFEELFALLLSGELNRQENFKLKSLPIPYDIEDIKRAIASLPFALTNAQRRAVWEIIQDLDKTEPMNRLLQGDVGSGKTLVAALVAFIAMKSGVQTALMAPTEVLANQHAIGISELFDKLGLRVALLTGSTKNKKLLKSQIAEGNADLIIGTHALITEDVAFKNLGLAIIDEQHRFGVKQRQALLKKANFMPHLLSMTATPIPRSLQLTVFGDLSVSILDELPAGRQPIKTKITSPNSLDQLWDFIREQLKSGHQIYYICKMIEDSGELSSVKKEHQKIAKIFPDFKVAHLYGGMKAQEKDQIMQDFANNNTQILVSTTVVEVGVNVPNATVMVIADADHYGLSQLHQLRGRVGRGESASYCFLISSDSSAPTRRLKEIEKSNDGFYLAEVDLKMRGPGEIYGALQHGVLDLKIANISDTRTISAAQIAAKKFASSSPDMIKYPELDRVLKKYQRLTILN